MNKHDVLIEQLCSEARPVKRPASAWVRAVGWMLVALPCGFLASLILPHGSPDWSHPGALWAGCWIVLSFCLGALAIKTAFAVSIAGHPITRWRWLAGLAVAWVLAGLVDVTSSADPIGHVGDGRYCYEFMVIAGIPMVVALVGALRYTRSPHPMVSLATAGLGIAAMSQILLGFCHPVAGELVDVMMHLAAAITLVAATVLGGWRWVRV